MTDAPAQMRAAQAPPYPAKTIAKWFIAWAEAEGDEISNLKLQKLLFPEPVQAWSHGPVVPEVYHAYKSAGSASIVLPDEDPFTWDDIDPETSEFLSTVWNTYGGYSAGRLRNMTHEDLPWRNHFRDDARHIVIPQNEIEKYFVARHTS